MLLRPLLRFSYVFLAGLVLAMTTAAANPLDEDACKRLQTERQALTVLGMDRYFAKGADWAKAHLTVADLDQLKRYLDVYEQLKFRCEKIVAAIEPEEKDEDDDDDTSANAASGGPVPPLPERKAPGAVKASTAPVAEPRAKAANSTEIVKSPPSRPTNASAVQAGPAKAAPVR